MKLENICPLTTNSSSSIYVFLGDDIKGFLEDLKALGLDPDDETIWTVPYQGSTIQMLEYYYESSNPPNGLWELLYEKYGNHFVEGP